MNATDNAALGMRLVVSLFTVACGTAATYAGQSTNAIPLSFEVASVRPNKTEPAIFGAGVMAGAGVRTRPDGSVVAVNTPLMNLIGFAYGLDGIYRTIEGSSKLLSERFDVTAKAAGPTKTVPSGDIGPMNVMMQSLLKDRFRLAVRWDDRLQQGYALVRFKPDGVPGPRMRPTSRDCSNPATYRDKPPGDTRDCALVVTNNELVAAGHHMADFSRYISRNLGRPVIDRTGLVGPYEIQMTFNASLLRVRPGVPPQTSEAPSLFVALQEQLGLKLEEQRVPIRVLVVEHVEPASEN